MKLRHLGSWAVIAALSLPAWAGERLSAISGFVRNASGTPQMGAVVEIAGSGARNLVVFTDGAGFFSVPSLLPGLYFVKVSAPSFLSVEREKVGLQPGTSIRLNIHSHNFAERGTRWPAAWRRR